MTNDMIRIAAGSALIALCAVGASAGIPRPYESPSRNEASTGVKTPETVIARWPARSRAAARGLIAKYGEPNDFDDDSLVWRPNGPWKRTVVQRQAPEGFGADAVVEQAIDYDVPQGKIAALRRFDGRLAFQDGELSSRAQDESLNFLALNLADEIVAGRRDPDQARAVYRRTVKLSQAGKSSPYMSNLLFLFQQKGKASGFINPPFPEPGDG